MIKITLNSKFVCTSFPLCVTLFSTCKVLTYPKNCKHMHALLMSPSLKMTVFSVDWHTARQFFKQIVLIICTYVLQIYRALAMDLDLWVQSSWKSNLVRSSEPWNQFSVINDRLNSNISKNLWVQMNPLNPLSRGTLLWSGAGVLQEIFSTFAPNFPSKES